MDDILWHEMELDSEMEWLDYKQSRDYYEILEVSPNASSEVIKKAYRVLVEKYHPDKHCDLRKAWAEEVTKNLNEAFSVLNDPTKRMEYDKQRRSNS